MHACQESELIRVLLESPLQAPDVLQAVVSDLIHGVDVDFAALLVVHLHMLLAALFAERLFL